MPCCSSQAGGFVDLLARQAIHDAGGAAVAGEESEQLLARIVAFDHGIADVGPVEAGNEDARRIEAEAADDFAPRQRVGRRGQRDARHVG
jgi:hypothetical protein